MLDADWWNILKFWEKKAPSCVFNAWVKSILQMIDFDQRDVDAQFHNNLKELYYSSEICTMESLEVSRQMVISAQCAVWFVQYTRKLFIISKCLHEAFVKDEQSIEQCVHPNFVSKTRLRRTSIQNMLASVRCGCAVSISISASVLVSSYVKSTNCLH